MCEASRSRLLTCFSQVWFLPQFKTLYVQDLGFRVFRVPFDRLALLDLWFIPAVHASISRFVSVIIKSVVDLCTMLVLI